MVFFLGTANFRKTNIRDFCIIDSFCRFLFSFHSIIIMASFDSQIMSLEKMQSIIFKVFCEQFNV